MQEELLKRIENLPPEKQELLKLLLNKGNSDALQKTGAQAVPPTATEKTLLPIWRDILKLDTIDIHDNFFKLGGDSLAATRLLFHVKQIFNVDFPVFKLIEMPTVAKLAASIDAYTKQVENKQPAFQVPRNAMNHQTGMPSAAENITEVNDQGLITGTIPAIPNALIRYVYSPPAPWWEFKYRLDIPLALDAAIIKKAIKHIIAHHDGLRLRLVPDSNFAFGYSHHIASPDTDDSFGYRDISELTESEQEAVILSTITKEWANLNIAAGPVIRFIYFNRGGCETNCLLIIVHHFVADMISLYILREDFLTICYQLLQGKPISLPAKSSSILQWAERMKEYALSANGEKEFNYWNSLPLSRVNRLPEDYPEGRITGASVKETISGMLTAEETSQLLGITHQSYNVGLMEILLTGLLLVFRQWAGTKTLLLTVVDHARNQYLNDIDLSRTVGDIACAHLEFLELGDHENADALQHIKEQRSLIPNNGSTAQWVIAYRGQLKDSGLIPADFRNIQFNYLGQWDNNILNHHGHPIPLNIRTTPCVQSEANQEIPGWQFNIVSIIMDGKFSLNWSYYKEIFKPATVEFLVREYLQTLRSII